MPDPLVRCPTCGARCWRYSRGPLAGSLVPYDAVDYDGAHRCDTADVRAARLDDRLASIVTAVLELADAWEEKTAPPPPKPEVKVPVGQDARQQRRAVVAPPPPPQQPTPAPTLAAPWERWR